MDVNHIVAVVTQITDDLMAGCDFESIDSKYSDFKETYPKILKLAKSDPKCLEKLKEVQKLKEKRDSGSSQHEVSVEFGQILADQYLKK